MIWIALCAPSVRGQAIPKDVKDRFAGILKDMEVKSCKVPPPWAEPGTPPLFRFAQIADIHLTKKREPLLGKAIGFLNRDVKPAFVAVTGDNSGKSSMEGQGHLKAILDGKLEAPCYIVRGDNWARNFSKVFGSTRYAFECGGIRFVFTGLDRDDEGKGIGVFREDTWQWMRKELSPERPMPVILLMHENVQPPVFVDAGKLDSLLERSPCAAATLTGHLHFDLEFRAGRVKHILAPALGPNDRHPFKVYDVFEEHIVVRTAEWNGTGYGWVKKYQKIDLPHPAGKPEGPPIRDYRELPPRETVFDMKMKDYTGRIVFQMVLFGRRVGMLELFLRVLGNTKEKAKEEEEEEEEEDF